MQICGHPWFFVSVIGQTALDLQQELKIAMSQTDCQLIYSTTSSVAEATSIGKTLVQERLAACVNILPGMQSIYQWQGQLETAQEAVLLVKTTADCTRKVISRIETLHSYDCPAVIVLDISAGSLNYLNWLRDQVAV